jgi:hypothetical protein
MCSSNIIQPQIFLEPALKSNSSWGPTNHLEPTSDLRIYGYLFMDIYLWIFMDIYRYIFILVYPQFSSIFSYIFLFFSIVFHFFSHGNNSSSHGGPLGGDGNGGGHWRSGSRPEPRGGFSKARWLMIIGCHIYICDIYIIYTSV